MSDALFGVSIKALLWASLASALTALGPTAEQVILDIGAFVIGLGLAFGLVLASRKNGP